MTGCLTCAGEYCVYNTSSEVEVIEGVFLVIELASQCDLISCVCVCGCVRLPVCVFGPRLRFRLEEPFAVPGQGHSSADNKLL